MERRSFIFQAGFLPFLGLGLGQESGAINLTSRAEDQIKPVHLKSREPLAHGDGMQIRVWVRSEMTNGVYSNVECAVGPKVMGPPPHSHKALDELMYVTEGTASILIGDDIIEVKAGEWHLRPRNIKHTFWNASDDPLRFIDMYFNQPFEVYLEKIFFEINEKNGYIEGSEKKTKAIMALNDEFGLEFPADSFSQRDEIIKRFGLR